jgi:hypothetical protein
MLDQRNNIEQDTSPNRPPRHFRTTLPFLIVACVLLILVGLLRRAQHNAANSADGPGTAAAKGQTSGVTAERAQWVPRRRNPADAQTPEGIVAAKVTQFARSRRDIVRAIARRTQREVPSEIEQFFDAIESGVWEEIEVRWKALSSRSAQYEGSTHSPELDPFWPAVLDAYGVAEQAHLWPAQKLLDYGNSILDSLRPGMVYVGGTDNGRWIPELLNETSGTDPHIIVTQNAMADARYLEYMNTLYSDRFTTLTSDDSQRAFQEYIDDAQKRFEHDRQFPDEPKQVRPGEDIRVVDGKVQVSGQVAVMAINERLLQTLMLKNPDLSFAVQESFPMTGTYADALPLGPLMELRAQDGQNAFTPERATQSLEYWRSTARQILSDPDATGSSDALKSYSHDAVSAANLLAAHNFPAEAEEAYRLSLRLWPESPESVAGLANLLTSNGRGNDAQQLVADFQRQYPKQSKDLEGARARAIFPIISE